MEGFKVFNKDLTNSYGVPFLEKHDYFLNIDTKKLKYGNDGYGYHFTKRLEDGLRYFDGLHQEIRIAKVRSLGDIIESYDDYYGYYDLYVTNHIYIDHILTEEEIIEYISSKHIMQAERFIKGYKLSEKEIDILLEIFTNDSFKKAIDYYQRGDKEAYIKCKR